LTDSQGRVINLRNTVIVMTSNLGSSYLNNLPANGSIPADVNEKVQDAIRGHFPPEFINRIDAIVTFNPLGRKQVASIVDVRLAEVQKRLHDNGRKITVEVDDAAKSWLADVGYNPAYGARPLNRVITNELLNPLSRLILNDQIRDDETAIITVDNKANRLVIKANHPPAISPNGDFGDIDIDMDDVRVEELD